MRKNEIVTVGKEKRKENTKYLSVFWKGEGRREEDDKKKEKERERIERVKVKIINDKYKMENEWLVNTNKRTKGRK